jgi:hypothetical protein
MVIVLITENGCHQYLWGYGGWGSVAISYHDITTTYHYMNGFLLGLADGFHMCYHTEYYAVYRSLEILCLDLAGIVERSERSDDVKCEMWLKREWWTLFLWVMHSIVIIKERHG